jgi:hypothetical protein
MNAIASLFPQVIAVITGSMRDPPGRLSRPAATLARPEPAGRRTAGPKVSANAAASITTAARITGTISTGP